MIKLAIAARKLCEEIELPAYPKTSGSTGLHVLIPLGRQCTFEQSKQLGELLALVLERQHRDIATTARAIGKRGGKVYIDYLQNGHGKLIVSPFCARPVPAASVSMPLDWSEVNAKLDPKKFTIKTAPKRMEKRGDDPMVGVLKDVPDLGAVLERLGPKLGK